MSPLLATLQTMAIAGLGGAFFNLLGLPIAWMLGALAATMIASQLIPGIYVPRLAREVLQPILGVSLGSYFTPALIDEAKNWPEVLAFLAAYVVVASLFGLFYFRRFARFDLTTSFFVAIPGGLSDLTLVGASMGANIVLLGLVHAIRVLMVAVSVPFIVSFFAGPALHAATRVVAPIALPDLGILIVCGIVGYAIGRGFRIPAGAMLGPIVVSAAVHISGLTQSSPPGSMISVVQVVLGAYIGARFVDLQWNQFRSALFHGLVWGAGLIAIATGSALLCARVTGFGLPQLLLAFAPGGIAEMGLLTLSLGIDVALVTTCHIARILLVYLIVPVAARRVARTQPVRQDAFTDD